MKRTCAERSFGLRRLLLASSVASGLSLAAQASGQTAEAAGGLEEIIVTAQKREQSVQDVPVAVTALSGDVLKVNRVVDVTDLTGLAPGVTVRTAAGGSKLPQFVTRGSFSSGLVPGSDKQVSLYLDGVYLSSPRGSIFDLPNVERIEILRGPQGTLFGRNATAGAISIATRDPAGEFGGRVAGTIGNFDQQRMQATIDLPTVGPFSAYVSFTDNYKRGDIRNAGAGQVWNRTAAAPSLSGETLTSPKYLGTRDSKSWFAALKFEQGDFATVYKFDRSRDHGTPEGTGLVGLNTSTPLIGPFLNTLVTSQPEPVNIAADGKRLDVVNNAWAVPSSQRVEGHSLTSTFIASDHITLKNVAAYRESSLFSVSALDGMSSLPLTAQAIGPYATFVAFSSNPALAQATPAQQSAAIAAVAAGLAPLIGAPFVGIAGQNEFRNEQISEEIQVNYAADLLTAMAGALWFESKDWTGEGNLANTVSFTPLLNGVVTQRGIGNSYNKATSIAGYTQLEFHLSDQFDLVGGARITQDKKSGRFTFGTPPSLQSVSFDYKKTKPSYLLGINYMPTDDVLVYAKYSTAYVSGGSTAGIPFEPETAESWEGGVKAELFDRRMRADLAVYSVTYDHFQVATSGTNYRAQITAVTGNPLLASAVGTFVADQGGPVKARGFEFDLAALPIEAVQVGGSLSYTKTTFEDVSPILLSANGGAYQPVMRPKWTAGLWAQYETMLLAGNDAYLSFRVDGAWNSDINIAFNPSLPAYNTTAFAHNVAEIPAHWIVNARLALKELEFAGVSAEIALWSKNLTDSREKNYGVNLSQIFAQANYEPARTYGLDLTLDF